MKMIRLARKSVFLASLCGFAAAASAGTWQYDFNEGTNGAAYRSELDVANAVYDTSIRYGSSGASVKSTINSGAEGSIGVRSWVLPNSVGKGDQIWVRFRTYYPSNFSFATNTGFLKFIRLYDTGAGYFDMLINNNGANSSGFTQQHEVLVDRAQPQVHFADSTTSPHRGQWETWEVYIKLDETTNGRWRFWRNGVLLKDQPSMTLISASSRKTKLLITDYWNGGAPQTQSMYLDDLIITTDTPSARDAAGNAMIGPGDNFVATRTPNPPTTVAVQ